MSARRIISHWNRQPPEFVRLRENLDISAAFLATAGTLNLATGAQWATVSGAAAQSNTSHGAARGFSGSSNIYLAAPTTVGTGGWTVGVVVSLGGSTPDDSVVCGVCDSPGNASHDRNIRIYANAFRAYIYDGGMKDAVGAGVVTGQVAIITSVCDGSNLSINVNGVRSANTAVANAGYTGYSTPTFCVGKASDTNLENNNVLLAFKAERAWTDSERARFAENPWSVFAKARTYFLPSAGGGGATITADSGTFALSGTAVDLKANRKLSAESGTFALTGSDVALRFNRRLAADSGTFTFNGSDVAFARGLSLAAESGSYTLSGTDVSLKAGRKLAAESGTYSISGSDVTLTYSPAGAYTLTAESGGFTLTGSDAALRVNRKLAAESGTFSLTGSDVGLARAYTLDTESGTYVLTGSDVAFARTYRLVSESGSYVLAGSDVSLVWSGQPVDVTHVTGGGGSRPSKRMLVSERKVREEVDEYLRKKSDAALLRQIQREDDEFVLIMAALAA